MGSIKCEDSFHVQLLGEEFYSVDRITWSKKMNQLNQNPSGLTE